MTASASDGSAVDREFDRQLQVLIDLGYPGMANLKPADFTHLFESLRAPVHARASDADWSRVPSRVPFLLVVSGSLIRAEELVPLMKLAGDSGAGVLDRNYGDEGLNPYREIPELDVPEAPAYAVLDVDRGEEFCGIRPADAVPVLRERSRTPLTIPEGIALVTLFAESLEKNKCFMLAGSRRGDRRVPAIWISGRAPKLGWCWEGNPHTWLGTASAGARIC